MFILSQNKEKLYNLSGHIEGIGYEETKEYTKGKKEDKMKHMDEYGYTTGNKERKVPAMLVVKENA